MAAIRLREGIYAVGVMNPAMRVFDIIMKTEYGTSYNAYLVCGNEKTALIETVHRGFFDEYLENIKQIMPVDQIDYIVLNHTEPDHSGSLEKLLECNPNITVVASPAAQRYLPQIANRTFQAKTVKDGDQLDLGGKTLQFINAPFLHWPDSMFTYVPEEKILFSCDFLGAHYCEPRVYDRLITYPKKYAEAFEVYYNAIMGPFKEYVLKGLEKIENLDLELVAPSHGPVLESGIRNAMQLYYKWSAGYEEDKTSKKISIFYVSAYGCTRQLAEAAAEVCKENGYHAELYNIIEHDMSKLVAEIGTSRGLMFGSPTINRDALKPVWDLLSSIDAISQRGKKCAVFGSYGWSGEAVGMICRRLADLKLTVAGDGFRANFVPSESELEAMRAYTKEFIASL